MDKSQLDLFWEARNELSDLINTYRGGQGIEDEKLNDILNDILDLFDKALGV